MSGESLKAATKEEWIARFVVWIKEHGRIDEEQATEIAHLDWDFISGDLDVLPEDFASEELSDRYE